MSKFICKMFENARHVLTVFTLLYNLHVTVGGFDHWCSPGMLPTGNCGRSLDEVLRVYCGENGYNYRDSSYENRQKRDTTREIKMELKDIIIGGQEAKNYFSKRTNFYYQGIVCECCIYQCDIDELISYCNL
ncbi:molluscan insulin-related peptide 3-like [Mercenaria mercenaria]|uniref:molluscan insulin-related peptide 3-like n=1 Tax=Mercenaria mercenaria TaxID=6596 RepID=UPI001E1D7B9C|nr:molluscan insulin-related peptide 3-like [Mercenaria mercenaria]